MSHVTLDERRFLDDLRRELREPSNLSKIVEEEQFILLDREPDEGDLLRVAPPAIIMVPGGPWQPTYYGDLCRIEDPGYPVLFLPIAQTWDASDDSDRWTDPEKGGAALRQKLVLRLGSLGPNKDGAFVPTGSERVNFVTFADHSPSVRLRIEEGVDFSIPALLVYYDMEIPGGVYHE